MENWHINYDLNIRVRPIEIAVHRPIRTWASSGAAVHVQSMSAQLVRVPGVEVQMLREQWEVMHALYQAHLALHEPPGELGAPPCE